MTDLAIILEEIGRLRTDIKTDTNRLHDRVDKVEKDVGALERSCQPITGNRKKGDHWWSIFRSPMAIFMAFLLLMNLAQMAAIIWLAVRHLPGIA